MPSALPEPQVPASAVRTPVVASRPCPVCQTQELQGGQQTCSPACRRRRARGGEAERQALPGAEVLALLEPAERLEARAAELRAQACQHLRT